MVDTPTADNPREPDITPRQSGRRGDVVRPPETARAAVHHRDVGAVRLLRHAGAAHALSRQLFPLLATHDQRPYGGFTALVYLTPLVGGLLADQYLGSKRSVKFGAIIMALGYLTLGFGGLGQEAKPFAMIDGQRYEVVVDKASADQQQYVTDRRRPEAGDQGQGRRQRHPGRRRRTGRQASPRAGSSPMANARPFFTMVLLIGLSMVTMGNGFFKPNISTMVGELYPKGDRRRDPGFTIFYMGINLGSLLSQVLCPFLATAVGWWAGLRPRRDRHAVFVDADPVRWRPARRLWRTARRRAQSRDDDLHLRARRGAGDLFPVHQSDERARAGRGGGLRRLSRRAAADGQVAVRHLPDRYPRDPDLVVARRQQGRAADDARGDGADRVQRRVLDIVRAGGVVADPVRRPQHRSLDLRLVHDLGGADADLQRAVHRAVGAGDEHPVDRAGQQGARAADPGQVRDRADRRRARLPVPGLGIALSPTPTSRSGSGGSPGSI